MNRHNPIWLVVNARSGSNNDAAIAALEEHCGAHGFTIARKIRFPDEDLPRAADLDAAGIDRLAVFTGDGTLNAAVTGLYGWDGAVLVLPGGTMNLLSIRLHGEATLEQIIERAASGAMRTVRPMVVRCPAGDGLAELLAGPGTAWVSVREAMRDYDVGAIAEGAGEAMAESTAGARVRCREPALGREEGYPLLDLTPSHRGIRLDAFHADTPGEMVQQSWALLRRSFRQGPHTRLGLLDELVLENCEGEALSVLIDGEPATLDPRARFALVPCEVDLLATDHGY